LGACWGAWLIVFATPAEEGSAVAATVTAAPTGAIAAFADLGPQDATQKVRAEIEKLKTLAPQDFVATAEKLVPLIEKYIERKRRVCQGEFSTIVLSGQEAESGPVQKLTPEEEKLCYQELKALEVGHVNNLFIARKRYLDYLHALRIEELVRDRDALLKEIQQSAAKTSNTKAAKRKSGT